MNLNRSIDWKIRAASKTPTIESISFFSSFGYSVCSHVIPKGSDFGKRELLKNHARTTTKFVPSTHPEVIWFWRKSTATHLDATNSPIKVILFRWGFVCVLRTLKPWQCRTNSPHIPSFIVEMQSALLLQENLTCHDAALRFSVRWPIIQTRVLLHSMLCIMRHNLRDGIICW